MARPVYPPDDYECPYLHRCPHLDYLSTAWVLGNYDRYDEEYRQHLRIVDIFQKELGVAEDRIKSLEKENAELKAKNIELHRRQFKRKRKKEPEAPSSIDDTNGETTIASGKKKRGAPFGHPGWWRKKPRRIDRTEHVPAPCVCPHCLTEGILPAGELGDCIQEHIQEDIVLVPKTVATKYIHETAWCPKCKQNVFSMGKGEMANNAPIGPVAKSTATYLRYKIGISYRKVQELFEVLFGMKLVPASLVGFDRATAERGMLLYEDLREKVRASAVVHADETSWRNDGEGHWAWYMGNPDLAFFHIDRRRSGDVAELLLGALFEGTLVSDRFAAYNRANAKSWRSPLGQTCLAHIIRKAKELLRELEGVSEKHRERKAAAFLIAIAELFSRACALGNGLADRSLEKAALMEKHLTEELHGLCATKLDFKDAETLRTSLIGKDNRNLFTFLRVPGVPPTNNQAEQSIRFMVIFRGMRILAVIEEEIALVQKEADLEAWEDPRVRLLMTIPGVDVTVALSLISAFGDISRFDSPDKAASYMGLVPSTHQSAENCYHGPITKRGRSHARWLLVQAAQHIGWNQGPLGSFYRRLKRKKGHNVAVVAVARKVAVIAWHMLRKNEPYRYAIPRSTEYKLSKLRVRVTGIKRKSGLSKGSPRPAAYGSGTGNRVVKALDAIYASEGIPERVPLSAGEMKMIGEKKLDEFVTALDSSHVIPKKRKKETENGEKKEVLPS